MVAVINLTSASNNMETFLANWDSGFTANYGAFWNANDGIVAQPSPTTTYDQWGAGISGDRGIVLDGSMQYSQGNLSGTVNTITLGSGFSQSNAGGNSVSGDLVITNDPSFDTSAPGDLFDFAIYELTVNGSSSGLYNYLAAVGTEINDTPGTDLLVGFGGADTFVFSGGVDAVTAGSAGTFGYQDGVDTLDVSAWGATSFSSLSVFQFAGNAVVLFGANGIVLEDSNASDLDASDFLFA
ncbi:MAG: hypothetical protein AAGA50_20820 [Pseudomonadota bacterium]